LKMMFWVDRALRRAMTEMATKPRELSIERRSARSTDPAEVAS
jgi:hypothetical protein